MATLPRQISHADMSISNRTDGIRQYSTEVREIRRQFRLREQEKVALGA